jgi:hypothetical protein
MANLYPKIRTFRNNDTAIERLSDHIRLRALPWQARRLVRRFGIGAATAAVIAELIYTGENR